MTHRLLCHIPTQAEPPAVSLRLVAASRSSPTGPVLYSVLSVLVNRGRAACGACGDSGFLMSGAVRNVTRCHTQHLVSGLTLPVFAVPILRTCYLNLFDSWTFSFLKREFSQFPILPFSRTPLNGTNS